ncbi:NAD(P)-dependent oxidoreductase [bacterium]|nr:NAD(P)-dependent oxidoreductase [bacterium]
METLSTKNILVIGGTGFIGHHLLKSIQKKGWQMTSISLNSPIEKRIVEGVRYLHFDMADKSLVKKRLIEDFDYVVNLSGYINHQLFQNGGRKLIETHFNALQNLMEVLPRRKLMRFVQIGSSDEYGNAPAPQHEDLRENPISPYSFGKVASTHFLQMLHLTENLPAVTLRLFLTYGPGQNSKRFLPQIIRGCLADSTFPASAGDQIRDFCHVDDTVRAILKALIVPDITGEVFNVASGIPITIRAMIKKICTLTGSGKPQFGKIPYRNGENLALYANVEKAEKILKWKAAVNLDKGLLDTIDWFACTRG